MKTATRTISSHSGTCCKRCNPLHIPNLRQVPSNPSYSDMRTECQYIKNEINRTENNNGQRTTHGIVHAGFRGLQGFVARKLVRCKLIGNRLVIPHDTIPSTVRLSKNLLINNWF